MTQRLDRAHGLADSSIVRLRAGVRAVSPGLAVPGATAAVQAVSLVASGPVALPPTWSTMGDALTSVPFRIAFFPRSARGERVGGLFVVLARGGRRGRRAPPSWRSAPRSPARSSASPSPSRASGSPRTRGGP